jgi:hypothetical protein
MVWLHKLDTVLGKTRGANSTFECIRKIYGTNSNISDWKAFSPKFLRELIIQYNSRKYAVHDTPTVLPTSNQ